MEFTLYLDESGDHGLDRIDPGFPVFTLCGIMFSNPGYRQMKECLDNIKHHFWDDKEVIFHSRDIRKCNKEFSVLLDLEVKRQFYEKLNNCLKNGSYRVVSAVIDKIRHVQTYGRIADNPYEIALSFIIERSIFLLDEVKADPKTIKIVIEKRGRKEDQQLASHFEKIKVRGTGFVSRERIQHYDIKIEFRDKKENINGLQVSDLIAYPISNYIMYPERANPAFDLIADKFYLKGGKRYGLKKFP
ncbi:DUF3800 domain-containing protein [Dyadobacter sp. OTU695]|uniref:DUF3800 domain-containing protein n=1 Tax=Dyadobacter sp. OTU695 TaxID=3043860 RepID=UPI00313E40F4